MKNTLLLLFILLLLGGGTYYASQQSSKKMTTVNAADRNFKIDNVDDIGKIFIADRSGKQNTFTRKGDQWTINGKYKVRKGAMNTLLTTIGHLELAFIPPRIAVPNIVEVIASQGIKVEIYDRAGKPMKTYYVGGMSNDEEATYMIMEGSEQPYAMKLPSLIGGLRYRYMQKEREWRDRQLIQMKPNDIASISMEYPKQRSKSFVMERMDSDYIVKPFYATVPPIKATPKKGLWEAYTVQLEDLPGEAIINTHKHRDSISQMVPFAILTLKDKNGAEESVRFHPLRALNEQGLPLSDAEVSDDTAVERYHADHSSGDYYLIQQRIVGKVFWDYREFFEGS